MARVCWDIQKNSSPEVETLSLCWFTVVPAVLAQHYANNGSMSRVCWEPYADVNHVQPYWWCPRPWCFQLFPVIFGMQLRVCVHLFISQPPSPPPLARIFERDISNHSLCGTVAHVCRVLPAWPRNEKVLISDKKWIWRGLILLVIKRGRKIHLKLKKMTSLYKIPQVALLLLKECNYHFTNWQLHPSAPRVRL